MAGDMLDRVEDALGEYSHMHTDITEGRNHPFDEDDIVGNIWCMKTNLLIWRERIDGPRR